MPNILDLGIETPLTKIPCGLCTSKVEEVAGLEALSP